MFDSENVPDPPTIVQARHQLKNTKFSLRTIEFTVFYENQPSLIEIRTNTTCPMTLSDVFFRIEAFYI